MKERHKCIPASYLILRQKDQVLLMRRANTGYKDGFYGLPSGHVDPEEGPSAALVREAKEELGIVPKNAKLVYVMYRVRKDGSDERVDFFFEASKWTSKPSNKEPHKCDELKWVPIDNLPEKTIPYINKVLSLYPKGQIFSEDLNNI